MTVDQPATTDVESSSSRATPALAHKIISVDDHVLEPPDVWSSRLPAKYADRSPRVERQRGFASADREMRWQPSPDGEWADIWCYEDLRKPLTTTLAAAGFDKRSLRYDVATFDDIRAGCWKQRDRLADMDLDFIEASVCFPNTLPRFCGQTFAEQEDKVLAHLCVQAYNDWILDDWCAGEARGRLIPLIIVPLWDAELAAAEVRRCAAKGNHAVSFSEGPEALGLPSLYTGYWEPFFIACEETATTVCIHVGSSSRLPTTASDAPPVARTILTFQYGMYSLIDMVLSGILLRHRRLKVAYSECNVGWMPYVLERMDRLWHDRTHETDLGIMGIPELPSILVGDRVFGCIIDDEVGLALRNRFGIDQICFETDYPHVDSIFPNSAAVAAHMCANVGLNDVEVRKFVRGNAIRAFGLDRLGIEA